MKRKGNGKIRGKVDQLVSVYEIPVTGAGEKRDAKLSKLVKKIGEHSGRSLELWKIEFLDEPGRQQERLIMFGNGRN